MHKYIQNYKLCENAEKAEKDTFENWDMICCFCPKYSEEVNNNEFKYF
jgi:hypothetical protein